MPTEISARPQGFPKPGVKGYEKRDVSVPWVVWVLLFMVIAGFAMHLIVAGLVKGFRTRPAPTDSWNVAPQIATLSLAPTGYPRLQISPSDDLRTFRAREEAALNSYGWVNQTAGVVHVPIDRAMEMVLQKGLPTRNDTNQPLTGPSMWELQQQRPVQEKSDTGGRR